MYKFKASPIAVALIISLLTTSFPIHLIYAQQSRGTRRLQDVNIDANSLADRIYAQSATQTLNSDRNYGTAMSAALMVQMYRDSAGRFNAVEALAAANQVRDRYEQLSRVAPEDPGMSAETTRNINYVNAVGDVIAGAAGAASPFLGIAGPISAGVAIAGSRVISTYLQATDSPSNSAMQMPGQFDVTNQAESDRAAMLQNFEDARRFSRESPAFAEVFNVFMRGRLSVDTNTPLQGLLDPNRNRDFVQTDILMMLRPFITGDGVRISQEQMNRLVGLIGQKIHTEFQNVEHVLSAMRQNRATMATAASWQAEQVARRQHTERTFEALYSSANIGGFIIGLFDRQAGRVYAGVVTSAIRISQVIKGLIDQQTVSSIGLAIATGNILSAGMALGAMMGPSADQMILEGINDLKNMVADISRQMQAYHEYNRARFDQIDRTLNQLMLNQHETMNLIYRVMDHMATNHRQVLAELNDIQSRVNSLHSLTRASSVGIQLSMNQQFDNLRSYLSSVALQGCRDFGRAYGRTRALDDARFIDCLSHSFNQATNSRNDGASGVPSTISATDPRVILHQLETHRHGQLTSYLPRVAQAYFGVPLNAATPLQVDDWLAGSEQMLQLLYALPLNRQSIPSELLVGANGHLSTLHREGEQIKNIFATLYPSTDQNSLGRMLWTRLAERYSMSVQAVYNQIEAIATEYENREMNGFRFSQNPYQEPAPIGGRTAEQMRDYFPGSTVFDEAHLENMEDRTNLNVAEYHNVLRRVRGMLTPFKRNLFRIGAMRILPFERAPRDVTPRNISGRSSSSNFVFWPTQSTRQLLVCGAVGHSRTRQVPNGMQHANGETEGQLFREETTTTYGYVPTALTMARGVSTLFLNFRRWTGPVVNAPAEPEPELLTAEQQDAREAAAANGLLPEEPLEDEPQPDYQREILGSSPSVTSTSAREFTRAIGCGNYGGTAQSVAHGCTEQQNFDYAARGCQGNTMDPFYLTGPSRDYRVWNMEQYAQESLTDFNYAPFELALGASSDANWAGNFRLTIEARHAEHRRAFHAFLSQKLATPSDELRAALEGVDLHYKLILAFLAYVFPESGASHANLRAAVFGTNGLMTPAQLKASIVATPQTAQLAIGRSPESRTIITNHTNLATRLNEVLFSIAQGRATRSGGRSVYETPPVISSMLTRLSMFEGAIQSNASSR